MDFSSLGSKRAGGSPSAGSSGVLNLKKGSILDLSKHTTIREHAAICGGWDPLRGRETADLDLSAILLGPDGTVCYKGSNEALASNVIYFNHMQMPGIQLMGDNLTGNGEGDDERININLNRIDPKVAGILFCITIFEADQKHQTFAMVQNAYIRLLDSDNDDEEVARYNLTDDYGTDTAVIAGLLSRTDHGWQFEAVGQGLNANIEQILDRYR